jgi:hypothetical protein
VRSTGIARGALALAAVLLCGGAISGASTPRADGESTAQKWIYYAAYPGGTGCAASDIWRAHLNGGAAEEVLPAAFDDFREGQNADALTQGVFSVSSTGEEVVRVLRAGETSHLFVYNLAAETVQQLTFGSSYDNWPSISPNGQMVAFMRSPYRRTFAEGTYHTESGSPSIYVVPITGGAPRRVPFHVETGTEEISWLPNGSDLLLESEVISVATGRGEPFITFGARSPYYDAVYASTWTPDGLLYDVRFGPYNPTYGGSLRGLPPDGLYFAPHRVHLHGQLLRHYSYGFHTPAPNAFHSLRYEPTTATLIATYRGHIVSGAEKRGSLQMLPIPQANAAHPELASGAESAVTPIANPSVVGPAPSCALGAE